jgi:hypothetical protein
MPDADEVKGRSLPVVVGTDNDDPVVFDEMRSLGWHYINHTQFATVDRSSAWGPSILDMILLGRGKGFVGTGRSTYSYLAQKRVETWEGGPTIVV